MHRKQPRLFQVLLPNALPPSPSASKFKFVGGLDANEVWRLDSLEVGGCLLKLETKLQPQHQPTAIFCIAQPDMQIPAGPPGIADSNLSVTDPLFDTDVEAHEEQGLFCVSPRIPPIESAICVRAAQADPRLRNEKGACSIPTVGRWRHWRHAAFPSLCLPFRSPAAGSPTNSLGPSSRASSTLWHNKIKGLPRPRNRPGSDPWMIGTLPPGN